MKLKFLPAGLAIALLLVTLVACNRAPARTNAQVAAEVQGTIARDSRISSREITVNAEHGVVTLAGTVSEDDERTLAARDAAAVDGVKTVVNNLVTQQAAAESKPALVTEPSRGPSRKSTPSRAKEAPEPVGGLPKAPVGETGAPASAQLAPAPPTTEPALPQPPPPPKKVSISAGTQLNVRLNDGLDTEKNQVGDLFHATLSTPIVINDDTVIPSGADIIGRVVDVKSAGRFAGNSVLTL